MINRFLASPRVRLGAAAGHRVAAHDLVLDKLLVREQGPCRQVRAQMDEPELGAKLANVLQARAQAGLVDVALPEALRQVSLRLENFLSLGLGFLMYSPGLGRQRR